jgi:hypothetical protein
MHIIYVGSFFLVVMKMKMKMDVLLLGTIIRRTLYSATVQKKISQPVCLLERLLGSSDSQAICCDSVRQSGTRI